MRLYNTLTRDKEELQPLSGNTVKMYTCGLTVYSQPHVGNWVSYVYWDVLQRVLQAEGYDVQRIQNITDVGHLVSDDDNGEDKMEKSARVEGKTAWEIADRYIQIADDEAYNQLKLIKPTLIRATDCIDEQIKFVQNLEEQMYTYIIENEGVYFDTSKLNDYGKLAQLDIEGLEAGARVSVDGKRNITDFALWKFSPKDKKRDMEWESPWGKGFPGWHLECSVIAQENLGEQIDIHTGGIDHIPVHHTNEIAQSEAVNGKPFSTFWIHNNHIKVDGGKMAKSKGNVYTLKDVTDKGFSVDAFKLMLMSKHYRTEGNFSWDILEASQNRLNNWRAAAGLRWQMPDVETAKAEDIEKLKASMLEALSDDLNTPAAVAITDEFINEHVRLDDEIVEYIRSLLGIDLAVEDITDGQKESLMKRKKARDAKDWATADKIRDDLLKQGLELSDHHWGEPYGQIWRKN